MKQLRHLGPDLLDMIRRAVVDPATIGVEREVLRQAIIGLPPADLAKLTVWQDCLASTPERASIRDQMNRVQIGRKYRRSVLPAIKSYRKVDFGDGLEMLFVRDHPAAELFMTRVMPKTGIHEPELVTYLRRSIVRGDLVVDIGAHVGYVSCVAAAMGATVLAVEMQPTLIPIIQINAIVNDLWNVHPLCAAISDRTGVVPSLRVSPSPGLRATVGQWERGRFPLDSANHDLIPSLTLDSLFPNDPLPALVKVDVEGAEARVLSGAGRLAAAGRTTFMVEVHARLLSASGNVLADILKPFPADRWKLSILTPDGTVPLTHQQFLDPAGPIARHAHNAPVLFEPLAI